MEAAAKVRYARMSPQKARLVADMVRGKKVNSALNVLRFTHKATARVIEKLIMSAKSNAEVKNVPDPEEMRIEQIYVNKGPVMKRQLPRARGRVDILHKPFSHVTVVLKETEKPKTKKAAAKKAVEDKNAKPKAKAKAKTAKVPAAKKSEKKPAKTAETKKATKKATAKKEVKPSKGKDS
ncbi:MAG: 50S ribosomal protein L22 [Nitrospinota bacterium]